MNLLFFLIFSSIEFAAGIVLILSMFMFNIRGFIAHITFASIILAQASVMMHQVLELPAIAPIVQLFVLIIIIWLMFRVQIFYSAIMVTIGYISFALLQFILVFSFQLLNIFTLTEVVENSNIGYTLQLVTSCAAIFISWLFVRFRLGFTFVPDSEKERINLKGENIRFLIVMFLAAIAIAILYLFSSSGFTNLLISSVLLAVILGLLLYLAFRKEIE